MAYPIPQSPQELTPALLTALLRETDPSAPTARSVSVEPMATDAITSTLARVRATYDESPEPHPPESFVWKRSLDDLGGRRSFLRGYRNEVSFYRDLARSSRARVPACYYADMEEETGAHILLLEDVDGVHPSDTESGATVEQVRSFIREIAGLHGAYWGRQTASYIANTEAYVEFYRSMLKRGIEYLEPYLDAELRSLGAAVGDHLAGWVARLASRPQTIVHGDAHGGNVLFGGGDGSECTILDWQGWHGDAGIRDVSRFVTLNLATPVRRRAEEALLDAYVDALAAQGITYPSADARSDYWIGVAMQWVWAVTFVQHEALWTDDLLKLMTVAVPRALEGLRDAAAAGVFE